MFTHYRTEGIVIKKADYSEADILLTVYTKDFGRVEVVARGSRKITSKLRPVIEFMAVVEIEFIQGKTCKTLTDAVIINSLGGIRNDLSKSAVALEIFDFTRRAVIEQQSDTRVWGLLLLTIVFVDGAESGSCDAVCHYFIWHLLDISGWRPEFAVKTIGVENLALVKFFCDADLARSTRMRLARRQHNLLFKLADDYLSLITK